MGQATYDVTDYAFYNDGSESASVIIGTKNNQQTLDTDTTYLLRFALNNDNNKTSNNNQWTVEFNHAGGGWTDVSTSAAAIQAVDSANLTEGQDTTQRIGSGLYITDNNQVTEDGVTTSYNHTAAGAVEILLAFQIPSAQVSDGDEILVRVYESANSRSSTYTVTADIDVNEGAAPVTVNLDTAAVTAGGQAISLSMGAVSTALDTAALVAAGQALGLSPGEVQILLSTGALTAGGQASSIVPGAASTALNTGSITATGQQITISAPGGDLSVELSTGQVTANGQSIGVVPGAVSLLMNTAALTAAAQAATIVPGAVSTALNTGALTAAGQQLALSMGAVTTSLNTATISAGGQGISVSAPSAGTGVEIRAMRQAVSTAASGTQNFDVSGWSRTPDLALFIITNGTTDGTQAADAAISIGATDGTTEYWGGKFDEDDLPTTRCDRMMSEEGRCAGLPASNGALNGEFSFSQWNSGGVQLTIEDQFSAAYLMTVIFFAGLENVDIQKHDRLDGSDGTVTTGFEADVVMAFSCDCPINSTSINSVFTFGVTVNGSGQFAWGQWGDDGSGTGDVKNGGYDDYSMIQMGAGLSSRYNITTFTSTGFDVDHTAGNGDTTDDIILVSFELPTGVSAWCGDVSTPTTVTTQAYTDPGFQPQALFGVVFGDDTIDSYNGSTEDAGNGTFIFANDSGEEFSNGFHDEDDADTTNANSLTDDTFIHSLLDTGSDMLVASIDSWDATGFTVDYTTVRATACQLLLLAIEEDTTATSVSLDTATLTASGIGISLSLGTVITALDTAAATIAGQAISLSPGLATTNLSTAGITAGGQSIAITPGAASVLLSTAALAAAGQDATIQTSGEIALDTAQATINGQSITLAPGAIATLLDTALLAMTGQAATIIPGDATIDLDTAALTAAGQTISQASGAVAIALATAEIASSGQSITVTPADTVIQLATAMIQANGQDAAIFRDVILTLATGDLTAVGKKTLVSATGDFRTQQARRRLEIGYWLSRLKF